MTKFYLGQIRFSRTFLIFGAILTTLVSGLGEQSAFAAAAVTVPMSASVTSILELSIEMRQFKDGTVVNYGASEMAFGTLKNSAFGEPLRGEFYFDVYLHPNASSRPYRLTQAGTVLTNGTTALPAGACIVTPWPADKNGAAYPVGAVTGTTGSFVTARKVLYESGPTGTYAPVAMTYAITSSAAAGATEIVPYEQAGGNYASTITFQIELA